MNSITRDSYGHPAYSKCQKLKEYSPTAILTTTEGGVAINFNSHSSGPCKILIQPCQRSRGQISYHTKNGSMSLTSGSEEALLPLLPQRRNRQCLPSHHQEKMEGDINPASNVSCCMIYSCYT